MSCTCSLPVYSLLCQIILISSMSYFRPSTNVHDNCHQSSFHLSKKYSHQSNFYLRKKLLFINPTSTFKKISRLRLPLRLQVQTATNTDFFVEETKIYTCNAVCPF